MGFLDSLKTWFRSESADAKDLLGHTRTRMESDLDRREAELAASPAQRLEQLQEQIAEDDSFDSLRDKIEGRGAKAEAVEELAGDPDRDGPHPDGAIEDVEIVDEVVDQVIEEAAAAEQHGDAADRPEQA